MYFHVQYKLKNQKYWSVLSYNEKPGGNFVVFDLNPATWYNLLITAFNNDGFSVAEYEFPTLTATGGKVCYKGFDFLLMLVIKLMMIFFIFKCNTSLESAAQVLLISTQKKQD